MNNHIHKNHSLNHNHNNMRISRIMNHNQNNSPLRIHKGRGGDWGRCINHHNTRVKKRMVRVMNNHIHNNHSLNHNHNNMRISRIMNNLILTRRRRRRIISTNLHLFGGIGYAAGGGRGWRNRSLLSSSSSSSSSSTWVIVLRINSFSFTLGDMDAGESLVCMGGCA